jgi:hypothetical protein
MKIAMDSELIFLYERMLNPYDRQRTPEPNLRYSVNDKNAFDIIDALEKIYKSGAIFCKLPINQEVLKENPKADNKLSECCLSEIEFHKINQRVNELTDAYDDLLDECRLLEEAEQCSVNIILTRNGNFIDNLHSKADGVRILYPVVYSNEIK